jgi:hypothetical protein
VPLDERSLEKVIGGVYSDLELESPGVEASDFVVALVQAAAR